MAIYQHIRHPRIASRLADGPVKVTDLLPRGTAVTRFNTSVALLVTRVVGSMWCAYAFALFDLLTEGAARTAAGATSSRPRPTTRILGDAEVAARYRELFTLARPDLEEELSRLIGDLPARRLSLAAQGALGWVKKLGRTAGENLAEYLQEESRDLAAKPEVEEFVQGVDRLRDTADRVEARLARIEQRLKGAI